MRTEDFDYHLPPDRIAQRPAMPRDASRLLVVERHGDGLSHQTFGDLVRHLRPDDALVVNESRVLPARLRARKLPGGGAIEVLLLRRLEPGLWEAIVGGRGVRRGGRLQIEGGPAAVVEQDGPGPLRRLRFEAPISPALEHLGALPLPPYIHEPLRSPDEYQTVYARHEGSAAAPTAGLHFTPALLEAIAAGGTRLVRLTLHVGLDTFAPVSVDDPHQHPIHREFCRLDADAAAAINQTRRRGGRVVAVGTTSVRTLETAARRAAPGDAVGAFEGETDLLILPGHTFRAVDALLTNFHLPRSSLLMLVAAFAGRERILAAYQTAIEAGYRFYSFGDAMLIR